MKTVQTQTQTTTTEANTMTRMNDSDMVAFLTDAMYQFDEDNLTPPQGDQDESGYAEVDEISTFANAEILTQNKGLVVKMADGTEWQIEVLQSR